MDREEIKGTVIVEVEARHLPEIRIQDPSRIRSLHAGGQDGDLGSEILLSEKKYTAIIHGSCVLAD